MSFASILVNEPNVVFAAFTAEKGTTMLALASLLSAQHLKPVSDVILSIAAGITANNFPGRF